MYCIKSRTDIENQNLNVEYEQLISENYYFDYKGETYDDFGFEDEVCDLDDYDDVLASKEEWHKVRVWCDKHDVLLIIDDVRCGFRLDLAGSDHYYGFKADLICFCKALANGYNMSCVCGVCQLPDDG